MPLLERFWSKVDKSPGLGPNGNCWEWTAGKKNKLSGYGIIKGNDYTKNLLAHRLSWTIANGDPGEFHVLHKCDNPSCVRPDHLFLGTDADNVADKIAKGRQPQGQSWYARKRHKKCKLSHEEVGIIREELALGVKVCEVARRHDVASCTISNIKHGRFWVVN